MSPESHRFDQSSTVDEHDFAIIGLETAIAWLLWALLLALTIVGLPFARQCLKLARLSLAPFGKEIRDVATVRAERELAAVQSTERTLAG